MSEVHDIVDRANIESQAWLDEQIRLARPNLAINECDDCIDCDKPIGVQRKQAVPSARRCIGCQSKIEAKGI